MAIKKIALLSVGMLVGFSSISRATDAKRDGRGRGGSRGRGGYRGRGRGHRGGGGVGRA